MDLDEYWFLYLVRTICFDLISVVEEVQSNTGCHGTPLMGVERAGKALDSLHKSRYIGLGHYTHGCWKEISATVNLNELIAQLANNTPLSVSDNSISHYYLTEKGGQKWEEISLANWNHYVDAEFGRPYSVKTSDNNIASADNSVLGFW
jgi:hypothetical protein